MAVALQDQGAVVVEFRHFSSIKSKGGACAPPFGQECAAYFTSRTSLRIFTACGPRSAADLSWIGCAFFMKPLLSTFSTTLTPSYFSLSPDSFSSLSAIAGSRFDTSSAAACTHFFCSAVRLFQVLSLTQMQLLFASCSVIDSTGATS